MIPFCCLRDSISISSIAMLSASRCSNGDTNNQMGAWDITNLESSAFFLSVIDKFLRRRCCLFSILKVQRAKSL